MFVHARIGVFQKGDGAATKRMKQSWKNLPSISPVKDGYVATHDFYAARRIFSV
jgi:hypothetical protein